MKRIFNHVLQKQLTTNGIKSQHHWKDTVYKTIVSDQPILAPRHLIWCNTSQMRLEVRNSGEAAQQNEQPDSVDQSAFTVSNTGRRAGFLYEVTRFIYEAWGTILLKSRLGFYFWMLVWLYCGKTFGSAYLQIKFELLSLGTSVCSVSCQIVMLLHNSQYKSHPFRPSLNNALRIKNEPLQCWSISLLCSPLTCRVQTYNLLTILGDCEASPTNAMIFKFCW